VPADVPDPIEDPGFVVHDADQVRAAVSAVARLVGPAREREAEDRSVSAGAAAGAGGGGGDGKVHILYPKIHSEHSTGFSPCACAAAAADAAAAKGRIDRPHNSRAKGPRRA